MWTAVWINNLTTQIIFFVFFVVVPHFLHHQSWRSYFIPLVYCHTTRLLGGGVCVCVCVWFVWWVMFSLMLFFFLCAGFFSCIVWKYYGCLFTRRVCKRERERKRSVCVCVRERERDSFHLLSSVSSSLSNSLCNSTFTQCKQVLFSSPFSLSLCRLSSTTI